MLALGGFDRFPEVGLCHSSSFGLAARLTNEAIKLAESRRSQRFQNDHVPVAHDHELGAGFKTELVPDFLRNNHLAL